MGLATIAQTSVASFFLCGDEEQESDHQDFYQTIGLGYALGHGTTPPMAFLPSLLDRVKRSKMRNYRLRFQTEALPDFRSDQKWRDYLEFADKFFFAVQPDFPHDLLPAACGLILADSYGGELIRTVASQPLAAARRKAITLQFARTAALRLVMQLDPALAGRCEAKDV